MTKGNVITLPVRRQGKPGHSSKPKASTFSTTIEKASKKRTPMARAFSNLDSLIRDAEGNFNVLNDPQCIGYMSLVSRLTAAMTAYMHADARQGHIDSLDQPRAAINFALAQIDREKASIDAQLEALLKEAMVFCGADAHTQPGYEAAARIHRKEMERKHGPIRRLTKKQAELLTKAKSPEELMAVLLGKQAGTK